MTWEKCRDFGLVVYEGGCTLRLFYSQYSSMLIVLPGYETTLISANWQGNSLIVRCLNQYKEPMGFVYRNFYDYHPI